MLTIIFGRLPCVGTCWNECESSDLSSIAVGELVPGVSAKLIREDGTEETRRGHRGEMWVRGPNVMKGYWRKAKETADTKTSDGWLKSGDVASVDEDGKWYVVDRKKVPTLEKNINGKRARPQLTMTQELIKVRGAQVAPEELEALLLEHPQIVDAAVIGVKTYVLLSAPEQPFAKSLHLLGPWMMKNQWHMWFLAIPAR